MPSMTSSRARGRELWTIGLLLFFAVVVPTAGVLWFMTRAMDNERLAVRQKLEDAYRGQLTAASERLEGYWRDKLEALAAVARTTAAPETFARLVRDGVADGVIVYDASGQPAYPKTPPIRPTEQSPSDEALAAARSLEFDRSDRAAAADAYAKIAASATDVDLAARALLGQARCLVKSGQTAVAVKLLAGPLAEVKYAAATDAFGRRISLDAQFRALQLTTDRSGADRDRLATQLRDRLNDYTGPAVPSAQRRFLMRELQTLLPDAPPFDTLAAEELTVEYLAADPTPVVPARVMATPLPDAYRLGSASRRVVALYRGDRLLDAVRSVVASGISLPGARIEIRPPNAAGGDDDSVLVGQAGRRMPDWELALHLDDPDPFAAAADRRIAGYLWTGVLVVLVIAVLALLVARSVARQMKLTRLKNDLIATVSHELKTPLASMRVLADTLLAGKVRDDAHAREYVELIAKENARLSRLIDNFLTFSRMERDKRSFESARIDVAELVAGAVEAAGERFAADGCRLEVQVAPELPTLWGDRDALITVLTNLLDNAYKYSDDPKQIVLRAETDASTAGGGVRLSVTDNGIGLSRRVLKRVFDRFYQADQTLSRRAGGCGLGLSIVKFILDAHDGSIDVASEPGRGSTFTVRLPVGGEASG